VLLPAFGKIPPPIDLDSISNLHDKESPSGKMIFPFHARNTTSAPLRIRK
jgi:hypothetical protein